MIDVVYDSGFLQDTLLGQAISLRDNLKSRIQQKLSGEVLHIRSGALAGSIVSNIENSGSSISVYVSSIGVPYAAIQEYGGKTAAHDIIALNAKALAFISSGNQIFARSVHHPGSVIPAHSYLESSLMEVRVEIEIDFKQAVLEALEL